VVGITYPHMPVLHPEVVVADDPAAVVVEHAARLRDAGCDLVVLALHDGVDRRADGPDVARVAELCARLAGHVDLVLGGHTLGHWVGEAGGLPFVQPWPFGTQLGVADVAPGGAIDVRAVDVVEERPWAGPGAEAYAALEQEVVGAAPAGPLACDADGDLSLARAIADGVVAHDPSIDATAITQWDLWNQAPRDGTIAFLPAGAVTMAQVLRLTPMSGARSAWGGQLVVATLPGADARRAIEAFAERPYFPGGPPAASAAVAGDCPAAATRLALPPFYATRVERALGRALEWEPCATTWRDGLLHACRSGL
jgi:hypothetical protein